jgi:hypothetical protein
VIALLGVFSQAMRRELLEADSESQMTNTRTSTPASTAADLDEMSTKVLLAIAEAEGRYEAEDLADRFKMPKAKIEYYLDCIKDKQLANFPMSFGGPCPYYLTSQGRKYLVDKGLL